MPDNEKRLTRLLEKYSSRPDTGPTSFVLASPRRQWEWTYHNEPVPRPYFAASITKLYTAAVIMQLRQEAKLQLDDPVATYLDPSIVNKLHVFRGTDYSGQVTVRHLLSHTSGIAGYFDQKRDDDGSTLLADIVRQDRSWTVEEAIDMAKARMSPRFAPGTPGKAFYSDTNFHLLGLIIARATGQSWEDAVTERLIRPLELDSTWPFRSEHQASYDEVAPILWGRDPVRIPLALTSVNAHGGLVTSAEDGITFLKAFMSGELFEPGYLKEMQQRWNRIFFPLQYGMGLMRYSMFTIGRGPGEFIGHSGSTGTVLFYAPKSDLYVSGNISQMKNRAMVYQLMSRVGALAG